MSDDTRHMQAPIDGDLQPAVTGPTRRELLLTATAVTAQVAFFGWPVAGEAQAPAGPAVDAEALGRFLGFSKAITGHDDLDPITSGRIRAALVQGDAGFATTANGLAALVKPGLAPEALLAAAGAAGLRDAALAVVAAWYTGTVGTGPKATVVAYQQALMYRPVADGLTIPTYCNEGPLWWTAAPPAAGVPTPQEAQRQSPTPPPVMRSP